MTDHDRFLDVIRANPADDLPRLAFADWLEEQGDVRAEFIRAQVELEPIRHDTDNPRADVLRQVERDLFEARREEWLGRMANAGDWFEVDFRRGFVDAVVAHGSDLQYYADDLVERCPLLRRVSLYGVVDHPNLVAVAARLPGVRELELCDWPATPGALRVGSLARFPKLEHVTFWLGRPDDGMAGDLLDLPDPPALKTVRLLQLYGGLAAGPHAAELSARANAAAARLNAARGNPVAHVVRPFEGPFPLRGNVGAGLFAGTLSGKRQALAAVGRVTDIVTFDRDGVYVGTERLFLGDELELPGDGRWTDCDELEAVEVLGRRVGFRPGLIRVKEFESPTAEWGPLGVTLLNADQRQFFRHIVDADAGRTAGMGRQLKGWLDAGCFVVRKGRDYWADRRGQIHTT